MSKRYRVLNNITREWLDVEADSAQAACQKRGWMIGNCWVREYSDKGSGDWKTPEELKVK